MFRFVTTKVRVLSILPSILSIIIALVLNIETQAQSNGTLHDGFTPTGLEQGAPAGSYPLSDFETIIPYNGNMNVALPLIHIGGRGSAGYTITLLLSHNWEVLRDGVTSTGILDDAVFQSGDANLPGYGPGFLVGDSVIDVPLNGTTCPPPEFRYFLTRLKFIMPDGTEAQLYDKNYQGVAQVREVACNPSYPNRGKVFVTADGESMTFISDTDIIDSTTGASRFYPSGDLLMKNGTRYRIDGGKVSWIRDRNGNKVTLTYGDSSLSITDSMNRQVSITYATTQTGYTEFAFKGFGGATRSLKVWFSPLQNILRPDYTLKKHNELFPEIYSYSLYPGEFYNNPTSVSKVELPDNRTYQFYYNSYGEIARIILPTGGGIDYEYSGAANGVNDVNHIPMIIRRCNKRTVYNSLTAATLPSNPPAGTREKIENYVLESSSYAGTVVRVEHLNDANALLAQEKHYYYGYPLEILNTSAYSPVAYSPWPSGKEFKTEIFDVTNGVVGGVLRRNESTWSPSIPDPYPDHDTSPPPNPKISETINTLADANLVSKQTFGYDQYNNQTDVYEYDFGAGAPGPLLRHTHTDYLTTNPWQGNVDYAADLNIHIRNLPTYTSVSGGDDVEISKTWFDYDPYGINGLSALQDCPGIVQHDGGFNTGYGARGNLVKITRLATSAPTYVTQHFFYDIAGNVVRKLDGLGSPTDFDFSDRFGSPDDEAQSNAGAPELAGGFSYAFPTKVTNALNHTAYTQYDYYLGKLVNSQDANNVVSSVTYNDALDRPTQGIQARYKVGGGVLAEKRQTTITYDDANHVITTTGDRDTFNDNILIGRSFYDGLGRTFRSATYEGNGSWAIKDTQFDALGRVSQVSNPYRAADPGSASPPSGLWTATNYDALGRPIQVITPDGAHVDTAYNGNQVTVTDQAGKKRRSETDALGRLTKVTEDPGGLNYDTTYFYDPLDNLRAVSQGGQGRWFAYDSLSRLIRVRTLEQQCNGNLPPYTDPYTGGYCWSTAYSYDANDNLTQRIDVRGIVTNYYYDALNRNYEIDYTNGSQVSKTGRIYDGAVNGKGRLYYDWTQVGGVNDINATHMAIDSYDALGRPLQKRQHYWQGAGWGPAYTVQHTYDLAGNVKTLTYPSGRTVKYSYDQAGQISSFSGNLGGSPSTYADTIGYNPAGQMIKERFGTNTTLYHKKRYNNRLQLVDLRLSTGSDELSWDRGAITFYYGWNGIPTANPFIDDPINNGNLLAQLHYVPTASGGYVQTQGDTYGYDALNRITNVIESQWDGNAFITNVYTQNFSYDRYGNRQITSATGGVNNYNPVYDQATNRINGLGYDAAGNITSDPMTGGLMTYDAENRMLTATNGGVSGSYTYNADGRRVRRIAGVQETWYIYGIGGELLAEYAAGAAPSAPQKEYGYRGGQLLVIAEPSSGGNLAWGKATSQSSTAFGGESSRGVDWTTSGNVCDN